MFIGADALALAPLTKRICYLDEDDWVVLTPTGADVYNDGKKVERRIQQTALTGAAIGKGNHRPFMMKEICEQPAVIGDPLQALVNPLTRPVEWTAPPFDFAALTPIG